jgi:hypothetical protein
MMKLTLDQAFPNPLTASQIHSVRLALTETRHYINKEKRYPADLQKKDYLAGLITHEANLIALLAKNNIAA